MTVSLVMAGAQGLRPERSDPGLSKSMVGGGIEVERAAGLAGLTGVA